MSRAARSTMTEVVDMRRGAIRVSGHLSVQGADLLRATVETLRRDGHATVVLDLRELRDVDDAGRQELDDIRHSLAAHGGELVVVAPPAQLAARP